MSKIPSKPEEIFGDFAHDYKEVFGADLISIILYGSAARSEYVPKKSDINFMIVLTDEGIHALGKALPLVPKWLKRNVSTPLFLTKQYIRSSLDSFPIEFLNFKAAYRLIAGEDVLADISFDNALLRLQCEREIKGKLLQLREAFLETQGKRQRIEGLISLSLSTFFSIFQAVLFLRERDPATDKRHLIGIAAGETGIDSTLFLNLLAIKEGKKKLTTKEAVPLMERYINEIKKLSIWIDGIETDG